MFQWGIIYLCPTARWHDTKTTEVLHKWESHNDGSTWPNTRMAKVLPLFTLKKRSYMTFLFVKYVAAYGIRMEIFQRIQNVYSSLNFFEIMNMIVTFTCAYYWVGFAISNEQMLWLLPQLYKGEHTVYGMNLFTHFHRRTAAALRYGALPCAKMPLYNRYVQSQAGYNAAAKVSRSKRYILFDPRNVPLLLLRLRWSSRFQ